MQKILLVDDDNDILELLGTMLEMDSYIVKYATNYTSALEIIEQEIFDVVISDYRIPKMHGLYLSKMVKDIQPQVPIIIITAYKTQDMADEAERVGISHVLAKPFSYKELIRAIVYATDTKLNYS